MPSISIPAFTGLNLRAAPHLLRPGEAMTANNCVLDSGALVPLKDATTVAATVPVGTKAVHYWNGAEEWVSATTDRWYAEAGQWLYWADGGVPQKQKVGGSATRLGIVAPATAPTSFNTMYWNYGSYYNKYLTPENGWQIVYTFYDPTNFVESAPSPIFSTKKGLYTLDTAIDATTTTISISALDPQDYFDADQPPNEGLTLMIGGEIIECISASQTVDSASQRTWSLVGVQRGRVGTASAPHTKGSLVRMFISDITLNGLESPPAGMTRREYANVAGEWREIKSSPSGWRGEGSILTSDDHDPPPNLTGIVGPHNGMLFGWLGKALRWTKIGQFDAWPEEYTFDDFPAPITACASWGGFLVVFTAEGVYTVSGSDPEALSRFKVQGTRGTLHPRSIANIGPGLLYVSAFGVELFDGLASRSLSFDKLGDRVVLDDPRAAFLRGRAFIFHDGGNVNGTALDPGCLICDLRSGEPIWTTASVEATLPYTLPLDDQMYVLSDTSLLQWESGSALHMNWYSGHLAYDDPKQGKLLSLVRIDSAFDLNINVSGESGPWQSPIVLSGYRAQVRKRMKPKRVKYFALAAYGTGTLYSLGLEYQ